MAQRLKRVRRSMPGSASWWREAGAMNKARKLIRNTVLGIALAVLTWPVVAVLWPFVIIGFIFSEADGED